MDNPRNPGLAGRDDVLAQLVRAVEELVGGRGGLVLLTGEAGIGKSAVVAAAAATAQARGARVLWGWGWPGEGTPAYWLWVQVFRSLVAAGGRPPGLAAGSPSLARLLPELPGTTDQPAAGDELTAAARFRLLDELTTVLLAATGERPLVVVLEDLQWADAPSLQLLDFLARRLPASRVLVLGTWRDLEQSQGDPLVPLLADLVPRSTVVPLRPLDEAETARLVAGILGGEPDPALVAGIRRRTGGNPFFVQQVARLLLAQPGEPAGIPVGVREVVERRLARLGPACATLVTTAAVAGPEFGAALLARVAGEPVATVRDLLDEAVGAHILDGPQGPLRPYRFVHDLFRESILAGLGPPALARLHWRVACALEEERDAGEPVAAAQLADHFAQGGPGAGDAAVRYAALAAAEATRRLAHEEAARQLARALEILDEPAQADRTGLLLELAGARRRAGDLAGSWQACLQAAELARRAADPNGLARAALGLHAIGTRSWPSPVQELVPVLEEAAAAVGDQDPPLRARVLASLARELAWNGTDLARASRLADEAMATARRTGDRATLGACLVARHNAGWGPRNAADRLALAGRIAELAGREDPELLAEARLLAATDLLELADPRFQRELAEFLRLAADLGQPRLRYAALARRAAQALLAGRLDQAERLTAEAADLGREIGEPDVADVEQAQLWELRSLQGRRSELLPQVRAVFGDDSPHGRCLQAIILLERGDRAAAEAVAAPLLDSAAPVVFPADRSWTLAAAFASELAAALEARPACQWLYDELTPLAAGAAVVGVAIAFRGAVDHHLGLLAKALGRPEAARGHVERAVAVHDRLGARTWALRSRYELALVLPAPADAAPILSEVVSEAGRLGMTELARQAADQRPAAQAGLVAGDVFRRDGTLWTLGYAGRTVRMRDAKGLRDLATLLRSPGRPIRAADLVAGADDAAVSAELRMGADEVLDERARQELRARLLDLEAEIEEAGRWHDPERAARAVLERDALVAELAAATGLGGRPRRLGDQSERARKTVTARIRDVIDRVERVHPALGAHLRASVTTGTFCSYSPPALTAWEL